MRTQNLQEQKLRIALHIQIDKDVVRRILARHYRPGQDSDGPSWLTFLGHMKDSLWSMDLFRCESATLRTHWVLVVMDQYSRRIIGFGVHAGAVDGSEDVARRSKRNPDSDFSLPRRCPRQGCTPKHGNMGYTWGTSRGDSLVANRRQNKGLWCSAVQLTAACSTIELPGNRQVRLLIYNNLRAIATLLCFRLKSNWGPTS